MMHKLGSIIVYENENDINKIEFYMNRLYNDAITRLKICGKLNRLFDHMPYNNTGTFVYIGMILAPEIKPILFNYIEQPIEYIN